MRPRKGEASNPLAQEPAPWMADAACASVPVAQLDLLRRCEPWSWDDQHHLIACAQVCKRCPVLAACRDFADRHHRALVGVWGGVYHGERSRREIAA